MSGRAAPVRIAAALSAAVVLLGAVTAHAAKDKRGDAPSDGKIPPFERINALPRHCGQYPRFAVAWAPLAFDGRVEAVYPHDLLAGRVIVLTDRHMWLSEDGGGTWRPLEAGSPGKLGRIRALVFDPLEVDTFYAAVAGKGLWVTRDNGKSFTQLGSRQTGLASDEVVGITFWRHDPELRTLLLAHGDSAPGLSRSTDGGKTWRVLHDRYHIYRIEGGRITDYGGLLIVAADRRSPDVHNVYHCLVLDDFWMEVASDLAVTGMVTPTILKAGDNWRGMPVFFSTVDDGLYAVSKVGGTHVGPKDAKRFASIGVTWGRTADQQLIYAYAPRELGLVVGSTPGLETTWSDAHGLPTGPFVREGAAIRANATGTVLYAVANNGLSRGAVYTGPHAIGGLSVTPPVLRINIAQINDTLDRLRERLDSVRRRRRAAAEAERLLEATQAFEKLTAANEVTIAARIAGAAPPQSVTVDLSRMGGLERTAMFDDGQHRDGKAGDGVYACSFRADPRGMRVGQGEWRITRGPMGLTVTAVEAKTGRLSGAVAVVGVYDTPSGFGFHAREQQVDVAGGPWRQAFGGPQHPKDVSDQVALSFDIRTDLPGDEEVYVQLVDAPPFSTETRTPPLAILKEGLVPGGRLGTAYVSVVVPMKRLLQETPDFLVRDLGQVVFTGSGESSGSYWIRDIRFHIDPRVLEPKKGNVP